MKGKFGKGLIIGRFQPVHRGHVEAIRKALKECEKVTIAIGSAQEKRTERNPFSAKERKKMIEKSLGKDTMRICFVYMRDFGNNGKWMKALLKKCGNFDVAYSSNPIVASLLKKCGKVKPMRSRFRISGTEIREMIARGRKEWRKFVPEEIAKEVEKKLGKK